MSEPFESYCQVPRQLGKGYTQSIEVHPQVWLEISNCEYYDDVFSQGCDCDHPLEFAVRLSGKITDEFGGQLGEGIRERLRQNHFCQLVILLKIRWSVEY